VQPLENIKTISLYSLIGAVAAGAVIIFMTMIMIVRERRREIGVLKAIGASNVKVTGQFMAEAVTLTVLAAIIGIAIGIIAANPITNMLVSNSSDSTTQQVGGPGGGMRAAGGAIGGLQNSVTNVTTSVGWDIILYGFGAALLIAVVGAGVASLFIAKIRPAEVMRVE
jgi:putative ABC transport system permease protein